MATPVGMTAEQLFGYEVPGKRVELVRGQLVVREPPGLRHGGLTHRIAMALGVHLASEQRANSWTKSRGRLVTADPGFTLARNPDTVRAPDVAYISRERWSAPLPDGFAEFAPDLAIEVRSPSDRTGAVVSKVGDWLTADTSLVWVIDPAHEQVMVYRADGSVATLGVGDALDGETLLPAFAFPLAELFADD